MMWDVKQSVGWFSVDFWSPTKSSPMAAADNDNAKVMTSSANVLKSVRKRRHFFIFKI